MPELRIHDEFWTVQTVVRFSVVVPFVPNVPVNSLSLPDCCPEEGDHAPSADIDHCTAIFTRLADEPFTPSVHTRVSQSSFSFSFVQSKKPEFEVEVPVVEAPSDSDAVYTTPRFVVDWMLVVLSTYPAPAPLSAKVAALPLYAPQSRPPGAEASGVPTADHESLQASSVDPLCPEESVVEISADPLLDNHDVTLVSMAPDRP